MNSSRIALYAAVAATVAWTAKAIAIGTAGGLDKSPLEGPLFFAGLLCFVVAVLALGVALTSGRPTWLRVVASLVGFAIAFQLSMLLDGFVDSTIGGTEATRHWAWAEVSLWVSALVVLGVAVAHDRRSADPVEADRDLTPVRGA